MREIVVSLTAAILLGGAPALAKGGDVKGAMDEYCEPLMLGTSASEVSDLARNRGFENHIIRGQPTLKMGSLSVMVSDKPKLCLVWTNNITLEQGAKIGDAWARSHTGFVKIAPITFETKTPIIRWQWELQKRVFAVMETRELPGQKTVIFAQGITSEFFQK